MSRLNYGRHNTNTSSWELENTTTNMELGLCWTKGGGKELLTPSTSTSVPSQPRSWLTVNTSSWWACTSHTRNMRITTSRRCTKQFTNTWWTIKNIPIIGGDFNAELGLGKETECKSVGKYTLNESNERGDWLKSWLMLNDYSTLNTMFRKTPRKQTSFVSPEGKEKQIDYILTKRRYLRNVKDAEANDMIHMGSDQRCVMATFLINTPGWASWTQFRRTSWCTRSASGWRGRFYRVPFQQQRERVQEWQQRSTGDHICSSKREWKIPWQRCWNPERRLIEERRSTPKEEKQRLNDLSKRIKNASEKKRMKRQQDIQRILEEFKGVRNIPGIKQQWREYSSQK